MAPPVSPRPGRAPRRPSLTIGAFVLALLGAACATPAADPPAAAPPAGAAATNNATVTVYKSPTCGCCAKWVEHMQASGYKVVVHDTEKMAPVKADLGVPEALESCHTATVGGYVVEGHVPAADIDRLLKERPKVAGLAVPGMPTGSPGMEMPGTPADRYDVMAFGPGGAARVFVSH